MLWGKLIDHDRCIGCHACSVACKSENDVPLGSFRTWVKQVEKGEELSARRHFGVLRCNQCENAPCVEICPTAAMHRRPDGIVDFDNEICVGCKACIQACPYDAIYMDPRNNTAAKCNFCAHRVEVGLEPACVSACPTSALVVSDLDDAQSPVSQAIARFSVDVRKPELGTRPKVFYKGADQSVLDPRAALRPAEGYWGESRAQRTPTGPNVDPVAALSSAPRALPVLEVTAGTGAPAAARVAYDVPREGAPWGAKISAYLATKAIGAGALMVGGLGLLVTTPERVGVLPPLLGLIFLTITTLLLVADLRRPERFLLLLLRPQSKSWLVKGAYVLMAAVIVAACWGLLLVSRVQVPPPVWQGVGALGLLTGSAAAGYTAFLFAQARGRSFWQSPLLLPHLIVQGLLAGCSALAIGLAILVMLQGTAPPFVVKHVLWLGALLAPSLALNLVMVLAEQQAHGNADNRVAIEWLHSEDRALTLTYFVYVLGHVFPFVALAAGLSLPGAWFAIPLASVGALAGMWCWDHLYVGAGQAPSLS